MFIIRPAHLEAFAAAARESFEDRVRRFLARRHPGRVRALHPDAFREQIQSGIERARQHEITTERDVCVFLRLGLLLGRNFDTAWSTRWIRPWLARRDLPPAIRLNRLLSLARIHGVVIDEPVATSE